jgi:site-specific DNA-methyltransferase (adenine-specific)
MKVINGNNIDILKQYPDNYFDAIVTDPPYGLGKEPNAEELMKDWIEKGYHEITGTGFMGKEWDAFIPQPIFWKEVFRVLKHGGHVLSFFGTRTYDWGVMSMRFAGFEVRDCIQWLYGSGFPKSLSVSKSIDKQNKTKEVNVTAPSTEKAKEWDGWGSALKPANEPIVLARKPLEKGLTIAENVLKWGTGAINIDACRVGISDKVDMNATQKNFDKMGFSGAKETDGISTYNPQGRFPANIILTHHEDCECIGTKKVKPSNGSGKASENGGGFSKGMFGDGTSDNIGGGFTDANGEETVEDWICVDDCPIKILDEQSGILKSGAMKKSYQYTNNGNSLGKPSGSTKQIHESNQGGASRFFYVAKASKSERNKGLDGFKIYKQEELSRKNFNSCKENGTIGENPYLGKTAEAKNIHPTVKPIKLMQYLVRLITPPNGIVLDPFCGSGTTGVACKLEGFQFVGLEQDAEYSKIAQARIDNYVEEKPFIKKSIKTEVKSNQIDIFNNE